MSDLKDGVYTDGASAVYIQYPYASQPIPNTLRMYMDGDCKMSEGTASPFTNEMEYVCSIPELLTAILKAKEELG